MGDAFHQHERGEISDEEFAAAMCHEMNMPLSYEQFAHGWQAVFLSPCVQKSPTLCKKTSRPGAPRGRTLEHQPITYHFSGQANIHKCVLPQIMCIFRKRWGCANPKRVSTKACCRRKDFSPQDAVFFDDNADNIAGANQLGITSILVTDKETIPNYFAKQLC